MTYFSRAKAWSIRHPLLLRFSLVVLLPIVIAIYFIRMYLQATLPEIQGDFALGGIRSNIEISRSDNGFVEIKATTDKDAFFAMGYVHAQDRLWQLELQKRITQGRLSEIFGKESIGKDVWFRTLGLYSSALQEWDNLSDASKESLQAYTNGVNAWLDTHDKLPPEFLFLDIKPEPWTVYDSLAWTKVFALNLSGNFRQEMSRLVAKNALAKDQLEAFFSGYPDEEEVVLTDAKQQDALIKMISMQYDIEQQLAIGGKYVGSNAWVVSGSITKNGSAILSNDPHLGLQIPSLWYPVSLQGKDIDVRGMSLVGLPLVIFGRNVSIAWGGTNMMADAQDLFLEQVNPQDANQYRRGEQWELFETSVETIQVKSDFPSFLRKPLKPINIKIRKTVNGPIISDLFDLFEQPVALKWTALDENDRSYQAFYELNYANNWNKFNQALTHLSAPALNVFYADVKGNIGMLSAGKIPVRKHGEGTFPLPGWEQKYEWDGYVPYANWPSIYNPESGFIVNANNKVVSNKEPYFISHDWAPSFRAERIEQLLKERINNGAGLSVSDMESIQADTFSRSVQLIKPLLVQTKPETDNQEIAIETLKRWDGNMHQTSTAAAIYYVWVRHLKNYVFSDELQGYFNQREQSNYLSKLVGSVEVDYLAKILQDESSWCDNVLTLEKKESCSEMASLALASALMELYKLEGDADIEDWTWGEVHKTVYSHTPFSQVKLLNLFYEKRISNGGSPDTINVASANYNQSDGYIQSFGAGFRQVFDMFRDNPTCRYMNSTGQSGHPYSEHYDDTVELFRDVKYFDMKCVGRSEALSTIKLVPQMEFDK